MTTEKFVTQAKAARHCLKVADHMLNVTYPLVKDPKLLLAVVENLYLTVEYSISAFLHYERFYRRIPPFQDTPDSLITTFTMRSIPTHGFPQSYIALFNELKNVLDAHKNAAVEFTRHEKLVMATESFKLKTLTQETIKETLKHVKVCAEDILGRIEES